MYAVILAGGGGTRLWPLSRADRPKPFLPLLADRTLLQATVARLSPLIEPRDVYVVTDRRYAPLCREQLPDVPVENLIGEPVGRNTAAAVALAAAAIDRPMHEVMAVLPADAHIADEKGFRAALATAERAAGDGRLVTLGIEPTAAETGYGYVLAREGEPGAGVSPVERFIEKPSRVRAEELLSGGRAYWNAGIFVWRRDAVLAGLESHAANILAPIRSAVAAGAGLDAAYGGVRKTSIDYALLEPASLEGKVAVVPVDVGWSDLGSWAALLDALSDGSGRPVARTAAGSEHMNVASTETLVHADGGRLVVTVGLHGVIVVDTPDAVLVCSRDAAQDVRAIVDRLAAEGRTDKL